jgi:hypothetical protein
MPADGILAAVNSNGKLGSSVSKAALDKIHHSPSWRKSRKIDERDSSIGDWLCREFASAAIKAPLGSVLWLCVRLSMCATHVAHPSVRRPTLLNGSAYQPRVAPWRARHREVPATVGADVPHGTGSDGRARRVIAALHGVPWIVAYCGFGRRIDERRKAAPWDGRLRHVKSAKKDIHCLRVTARVSGHDRGKCMILLRCVGVSADGPATRDPSRCSRHRRPDRGARLAGQQCIRGSASGPGAADCDPRRQWRPFASR